MKKYCLLFIILSLLASAVVGEEHALNSLWDIPFGIPLEEAAKQFKIKTGIDLEMLENIRQLKKEDVLIAGVPFQLTFRGTYENTYGDLMLISKTRFNTASGEDTNLQSACDLYDMLTDKFGNPTKASWYIKKPNSTDSFFYFEPPIIDDKLDTSVLQAVKGLVRFAWYNIELNISILDADDGTTQVGILIWATMDDHEQMVRDASDGPFNPALLNGITSF